MISIIPWKNGLSLYQESFSQGGSILSNPKFLNYQRKQFCCIVGFRVRFPILRKFFFIKYENDSNHFLLPCSASWGG